jgi:glycosyltransferase involved in cell wall biosynthesis
MLITNIISPYRIPLFNYIDKFSEFDFEVLVLAENEENRQWEIKKNKINFDYEILKGVSYFNQKRDLSIHINYGFLIKINKFNPDIIITSGYDNLVYWEAFLYSKLFNKKHILWNGSTLLSSNKKDGFIGFLKKTIIKGADSYITYGTKAKEYLEYFGGNPKNIFVGLNTVDIDYFYNKTKEYINSSFYLHEREKYPKILFLFVGQFIERKGIKELIKVAEKTRDKNIGFIIVGDGPLKNDLEMFAKNNNLQNIYFTGFVQKKNIYKYYALADILVVPSKEEVWGLVVNEGLASGNYIIASDQVGSVYDIIKDNRFGKIFSYEDHSNGLKNTISFCIKSIKNIKENRNLRSEYAKENLTIERYAKSFFNSINSLN